MKELEIYIDGASKGNPGPSGIGVVICREGSVVKNISSFIGEATNNVAEYTALIYALEEALALKAECLTVKTDSQLLARQLNKVYKVRSAGIAGLYDRSMRLLGAFKKVSIYDIPREDNKGADKLATRAVNEFFHKKGRRDAAALPMAERKVRAPKG